MTQPKSGEPPSAASRRTDSGGETTHVDARQEQPLAVPVPKNAIMYPPGLCDAFEPLMDICQPRLSKLVFFQSGLIFSIAIEFLVEINRSTFFSIFFFASKINILNH